MSESAILDSSTKSKVIILGAGHGGLACAARLAVKGHEVTVLERSKTAVTIPEPITLPAAYRDLFIKTGKELETVLELPEAEHGIELKLGDDQLLEIPASGVGRALTQIENKLGLDAATQWKNYLSELGQLWSIARATLIESESTGNLELIKKQGVLNLIRFSSLHKLIKKKLAHPDLKRLANRYRELSFADDQSDLALLGISAYTQQTFGVYEPAGGFSALTNELVNRCLTLGVQIKYETAATPISDGNVLFGVELRDRTLLAADFVVVNDFADRPERIDWRNLPTVQTNTPGLYRIPERSWLGLGLAHAVLRAEYVAEHIGRPN